jgi:peptidoglycan/LPS O-acetylase OafA/YrhL
VAVLWVDAADRVMQPPTWWQRAVAVALAVITVLTVVSLHRGWVNFYVYDTVMGLACSLLLALVVLPPGGTRKGSWLVRLMEAPPLVATGLISYSLFLWHEPLLWWLRDHHLTIAGRLGFLVNLLVLGVTSWVLAALTYICVERPALLRKSRTARTTDAPERLAELGQRQAAP